MARFVPFGVALDGAGGGLPLLADSANGALLLLPLPPLRLAPAGGQWRERRGNMLGAGTNRATGGDSLVG
eukprot:1184198-Prorocentrum_minimum.AAC.1